MCITWYVRKHANFKMVQAEYVRVPMADSTLIPTPESVTDKEALLVGDVLPTGNATGPLVMDAVRICKGRSDVIVEQT